MKEKFKKHKKLFIILIVVIAGAVAVSGFFLYRKKKQAEELAASMNQPVIETAVRQDIKTSFSVQGRIVGGDTQIPTAAVSSTASTDTADSPAGTDTSASSSSSSGSSTSSTASSSGDSGSVSGDIGTGSGNTVKEVFVKVGDRVNAGDPLFSIDMSEVEDSLWLARQKAALQQRLDALDVKAGSQALAQAERDAARQNADSAQSVKEASEDKDTAATAYSVIQNQFLDAISNEVAAKEAWQAAQKKADSAAAALKAAAKAKTKADNATADEDTSVEEAAVSTAQTNVENAEADLEEAKKATYESDAAKKTAIDAAQAALTNAQTVFTTATNNLKTAKANAASAANKVKENQAAASNAYDDANDANTAAQEALTAAKTAYHTAVTTREGLEEKLSDKSSVTSADRALIKAQSEADAANAGKLDEITSKADEITKTRLTQQMTALDNAQEIKKAQEQLAKGTIVAGISGTVTAVNITAGQAINSSSPVVVSNLDELKVVVDVEEAHIADIFVGQNVYLTTDSTGDETLNGQVTYCAATPTVDSTATTATSDSSGIINSKKKVYYRVEVAVTSSTDRLRVGMNAKMEFVTAEVKDVVCVPNDTLQTDMDGDTCVYVLDSGNGPSENTDASSGDGSSKGADVISDGTDAASDGSDVSSEEMEKMLSSDSSVAFGDASSDTMTDSAGNVYRAVKVTTGATDGSYTEITSGNINEGDSLYGTGMTSDMTGMDGTDSTYTDNSQLLEGIYN